MQCQFGGVASAALDYELAPYVRISFLKLFKKGLKYFSRKKNAWAAFEAKYSKYLKTASVEAEWNIFKAESKKAYEYAMAELEEEGLQASQGLYHNLNTLESRPGSQLPFTSINFGTDMSFEGRKVTEWCLNASIKGTGKFGKTPIFPISIFKHKTGINDKAGAKNYYLKKLAITSLCRRIYPNFVNCDWTGNVPDKHPLYYKMTTLPIESDECAKVKINGEERIVLMSVLWDIADHLCKETREGQYDCLDLRFIESPILIEDTESKYNDYSTTEADHYTKINYLMKENAGCNTKYYITTESFGYNIGTRHDQYEVPEYDYRKEMASMGCRTLIGYDINGMGYVKVGRGNVSPITLNLAKIGIENGICLGTRKKADIKGFFKKLDHLLDLGERCLIDRFNYICSQNYRAGWFMYNNGTIADNDKALKDGIRESMKHGTNALGYIGLANACFAMFGKYHNQDKEVLDFAVKVVKRIAEHAKAATERHQLNFSAYATPAESSCMTICSKLQDEYGKIPGVCDREYLTNSHHVPVFEEVSVKEKIDIEKQFTLYPTGGCITYVEFEASIMKNPKAVEASINYGMKNDIPYLAINFPIDTCSECGYSGEIEEECPVCKCKKITRLRRVTGYLSTSVEKFNDGKKAEEHDRIKHTKYSKFRDIK